MNTLVILIILGIILYRIGRSLRGSLKIQTAETTYNSGSTIVGELTLKARKAIEGEKLTISLVALRAHSGFHRWRARERGPTYEEIYRNEILLESKKTYEAGCENTYPFSIPVPNLSDASEVEGPMSEALKTLQTLKNAEIKWELDAQLEAKGIDLQNSKDITIRNEKGGA